ncbi:MAG: Na+/H+ antiporter NhaA [Actinobacteria bacterium]|nr:Na+/H+ antiporter NhaA [Actinomycetota bacterium]
MLVAAVASLVWVNVDASSYESLWQTTLSIELDGRGIALDLREWVNSGLTNQPNELHSLVRLIVLGSRA